MINFLKIAISKIGSGASAFINSDMMTSYIEDAKSVRVLTKIAYTIFYFWLVHYCVTNNKDSMTTAITVTGGIVGSIVVSYAASKAYEKVNTTNANSAVASEEELESSD